MIRKELLNELSRQIIVGTVETGQQQVVDVFDGKIVFRKPIDDAERNGSGRKRIKRSYDEWCMTFSPTARAGIGSVVLGNYQILPGSRSSLLLLHCRRSIMCSMDHTLSDRRPQKDPTSLPY
jgi:hypothetical protein